MFKRLLHRICSRPRLISSQISNLRRFYCKDHSNYIDEQYFSTIKTDFDRNLSVNLPQKSAIENVELQPLDLLENKKDFNFIDEQYFKGRFHLNCNRSICKKKLCNFTKFLMSHASDACNVKIVSTANKIRE